MADEIYGGPDKNYFQFPGIRVSTNYIIVNATTRVAEIWRKGNPGAPDISIGTYNFNTNHFTKSSGFQPVLDFNPNDPRSIQTIKDKSIQTLSRGIKDNSNGRITSQQATQRANILLLRNTGQNPSQQSPAGIGTTSGGQVPPGTPPGGGQVTSDQVKTINEAIEKGVIAGTRESFGDVKYPLNLDLNHQDCINFSILKYKARTLSLKSEFQNMRTLTKEKLQQNIGSITLPIPGSITDKNGVDWGMDTMGNLQAGFGSIAMQFLTNGSQAAATEAQDQINDIVGYDPKLLEAIVAVKATEQAVSSQNLMSRQFGAILNPNMELLFNAPSLRDFTFQFRMTPRSADEAKAVRQIIRNFKQAMAVQRTKSVLLLKSPYVFGIRYLTKNEDHPYLNKFKECALTGCSVNYTPDNTYSVYSGEPSMTAYELTLTFQELEPIFNDDYGTEDPIQSIGY